MHGQVDKHQNDIVLSEFLQHGKELVHPALPMHHTHWKDRPVYMMDFEGSSTSGVVEYGVVLLQAGEIQETWTSLCRPVGKILSRDFGVHGIHEVEVDQAEPFSSAYKQFLAFRRKGVFAAHNKHAENNFLKDTWAVPAVVPDWRGGSSSAQEWGPWIDTLSLYRFLYPGLESHALGNLVASFGLKAELENRAEAYCPKSRKRAHCALYDALASALLLLRLEQEPSLSSGMSLGWLLQLSQETNPQIELF